MPSLKRKKADGTWDYVQIASENVAGVQAQITNIEKQLTFTPITVSSATNGSLFVDIADNKLKFKNSTGVVIIIAG